MRWLILVALTAATLWIATARLEPSYKPLLETLELEGAAVFAPDTEPNPSSLPAGLQHWVSWASGDVGTGVLTLGRFAAPAQFGVWVIGYPNGGGNVFALEKLSTGERRAIASPQGESWSSVIVPVPEDWRGAPVRLVAEDRATGMYGWLGVSEPYRVSALQKFVATPGPLARGCRAVAFVLLVFGGLCSVGLSWSQTQALPPEGRMLGAIGLTAAVGYAVFWCFFFSPVFGAVVSWALVGVSAVGWCRVGLHPFRPEYRTAATPALLLVLGSFLMIALLTSADRDASLAWLAQQRFQPGLPPDNEIPLLFAERLASPADRQGFLIGDWLSSDRPPLQTGWLLILLPAARALSLGAQDVGTTAGIVAQLAWIPALWWVSRWLGLPSRRAAAMIVAFCATGFFVQNSVFAWPKLFAGALVLGTGVLVFGVSTSNRSRAQWAWAAGLAALGILAHGGAWFSLLALIPLVMVRRPWPEPVAIVIAVTVAALLVLPWVAYQRFVDPPGDRLLKWHLAGRTQPDPRPFRTVVQEAYRALPPGDVWKARVANFRLQFEGHTTRITNWDPQSVSERRKDEFFYSLRSVGWWNLGWCICPIAAWLTWRRRNAGLRWGAWSQAVAWLILTQAVWILLLFQASQALIHQGSYAGQALLFLLPAAVVLAVSRPLAVLLGLLSVAHFVATWLPLPLPLQGTGLRASALVLATTVWFGMLLVSIISGRADRILMPASSGLPR